MLLQVRVLPRSSKNEIVGTMADGGLKIKLTAAPVDGAANEALINLLSKKFDVAKRCVTIVRGEKSKNKVVKISD